MRYIILLSLLLLPRLVAAQDQYDSLYQLLRIHTSTADESLARMDSLRQTNTISPFMLDLLQSAMHSEFGQHRLAIAYGELAFRSDSVRQNTTHFFRLANILSGSYFSKSDYEQAAKYTLYVLETESTMENAQQKQMVCDARFSLGCIYFRMGDRAAAYDCFNLCQNMLKESTKARELASLSFYLGEMSTMFIEDGQQDLALSCCLERERVIARIDSVGGAPNGYTDQQRAYLYSKMAFIYQSIGQPAKAKEGYRKFMQTASSQKKYEGNFIIPYLIASHQYAKAIEMEQSNIEKYVGDTINYTYLGSVVNLRRSYENLGHRELAIDLLRREIALTDSINRRERQSEALEMNLLYDTEKRKNEITEQKERIAKLRMAIMAMVGVLSAGLVIVALFGYRRKRRIRKKGLVYRQIEATEVARTESEQARKSKELFDRIANEMATRQIYTNPNLNRDDLAILFSTNTAYLSQAIKENTVSNMTVLTYLNALRLDHACRLIAASPTMPNLDDVAIASGFGSSRTLVRQLKKTYNLTPFEYQRMVKESNQ